jgi:serine/threonine-protein kinase
MVDRLLDGRYRVDALVARGGMAAVYLATDTRLERRVAVKVMHPHLADDPETTARFEREARAAARLSHPDVVSVYDQGTDGSDAFLVMEYVPGATLRDVLRDRGRLDAGEALAVMDHVLAALAAAHAAGLVHRDIKPENVLLTADGRVKVADFGLARAAAGTTVTTGTTGLFGTAAYLAPEQFTQGTADARSDVYSAGVLLFELLTGTVPFAADSAYALMQRHVSEDVPSPSSRAAGVAPQVDRLVAWATARDPRRRPADAGALHAALIDVRDRLGLHAGVPALPVSQTTRLGSSTTRLSAAAAPTLATATGRARPLDGTEPTVVTPGPPRRPDEPRRAGRRRRWPLLVTLLVLVVAAAAAAGWWLAIGRYSPSPELRGLTRAAATARLRSAGLHARVLPGEHSTTVPSGHVVSESPRAGTRVNHGATVSFRLSSGPVRHSVPSLSGETAAQAKGRLRSLDLAVTSTSKDYSSTIKKNRVIGSTPASGTVVDAGSGVMLVLSKGPAPVAVPGVAGMSASNAKSSLTKAGFAVTSSQAYSSTVANGTVISSSPAAGTTRIPGTTVSLVVSKGPHLYSVPDVTGQPLQQAIAAITSAGFHANPKEIFPFGPGHVVRQTPNGQQPHGTTIELDYY